MNIVTESTTTSTSGSASNPFSENAAVARCYAAGVRARSAALASGMSTLAANRAANDAYRAAMPPLSGAGNIRDFIACVAHGMLLEAISSSNGASLLGAAQVAEDTFQKQAAK